MSKKNISRRSFMAQSSGALAAAGVSLETRARAAEPATIHQATGTRVGEVTSDSAIVWTRLTSNTERNNNGRNFKRGEQATADEPVEKMEGACPGMAGRIRLRYGPREDLGGATATDWFDVNEGGDFIHQFQLRDLKPGTAYYYASETSGPGGTPMHAPFRGRFETAPTQDTPTDLRFCVMTCQGYPDRGHADGHPIYPSMSALKPAFGVLTGDLVYYDNDAPRAITPRLARYHWERMFSLPRLRDFTRNFSTYWLKDDHDTLSNDSWAGKKLGELTFAEGQQIFRQQAPLADGPCYRTFRWGRDLQIWFTDGRDYRSPNSMKDGPGKTIWGAEQKAWFKRTVKDSNAAWKILVSPTPLVGPDRKNKNDNHANAGFQTEGDEIRGWLKDNVPDNFFVVCGDRHWQFHSVHPGTGLNEFSVGAASDAHSGGTPGEDKTIHRFHRAKGGGFLSITVRPEGKGSTIRFDLRDVNGNIVYGWSPRT
ncbi:MAG: alkaline phosphatase [Gemmataceae bacterium]